MKDKKQVAFGTIGVILGTDITLGANAINPALVSGELEYLLKAGIDLATLQFTDAGQDLNEFIKSLAPAIENGPGHTLGGDFATCSLGMCRFHVRRRWPKSHIVTVAIISIIKN